jgi:CBS-domain-containing membrane protein
MITGIVRRQQQKKAHAVTAAELMTSPACTVRPGDTVEQAARIMYLRNVKRLPVVDTDGRLAGIVSRADVLAVCLLLKLLQSPASPHGMPRWQVLPSIGAGPRSRP